METVKYAIVPMAWAISSLCALVNLVVFLIKKACKKDTRKVKKKLIIALVISVITFGVMYTYDSAGDEDDVQTPENQETISEQSANTESVPLYSEVEVIGISKDYPIEITAEELVKEMERDLNAAKDKYNGKWVKITGTISDTSDGGIVYGYYLYGQKTTTGYSGIRVMCWCEDGPYSGSVIGDTQTFVGQVLEITTVNVTEIVDCERITE